MDEKKEKEEEYGVIYFLVKGCELAKVVPEAIKAAEKNKVYIAVAPNDALMIQASLIDKDLMDAIDIWTSKGYHPVIQTGKPSGCPPGGCT